jgi:hypothetical protein
MGLETIGNYIKKKRKNKMFKKIIVVATMLVALVGCGQRETVVYQQPQQPVVVAQPVMVQNTDPMTGVLTGMAIGYMMSNGMRYDGHNGYYDSHYHGPSRTIVRKTVVNNAPNPNSGSNVSNAKPTVSPIAAPAKSSFANRPTVASAPKQSFASRPTSSAPKSSFSSRRK